MKININIAITKLVSTLTLSAMGRNSLGAMVVGGWIPPFLIENPLWVVFVQFFFNPAKLTYKFRSHAKGHSQEFKIEEIEKLLNFC